MEATVVMDAGVTERGDFQTDALLAELLRREEAMVSLAACLTHASRTRKSRKG